MLSVSLGFDSLIGAFAVSRLVTSSGRRHQIAFVFGLCDALGALAGATLPGGQLIGWVASQGPILLAAYAVYVWACVAWKRTALVRRSAYVLPVLLCLDNFVYGSALRPVPSNALLLGLVSGAFALAGFALSRLAAGRHPRSAQGAGVAALLVLAATAFLG